jgi:hypothetical protein
VSAATAYLETLNPEQRRAVEHGVGGRDCTPGASRTRFIPAALLQLFECTTWPVAIAGSNGRPEARTVRVDVRARMRGMWR